LSPGSLATNGYNGHSFWDTETWMYPPILFFYNDVAKGLLQYRLDRLDAAKRKVSSLSLFFLFLSLSLFLSFLSLSFSLSLSILSIYFFLFNRLRFIMFLERCFHGNQASLAQTIVHVFLSFFLSFFLSSFFLSFISFFPLFLSLSLSLSFFFSFISFSTFLLLAGPPGSLYEIHITGDIIFAIEQYYKLTNDIIWLKSVRGL
jgi:hypothetical protein